MQNLFWLRRVNFPFMSNSIIYRKSQLFYFRREPDRRTLTKKEALPSSRFSFCEEVLLLSRRWESDSFLLLRRNSRPEQGRTSSTFVVCVL